MSPATPLPAIVLYSKPGCHLCEETRSLLDALLERRAAGGLTVPAIDERDITTRDAWTREFAETIPVLEIGERRLPLAIRPAQVRTFVDDALSPAEPASPSAEPAVRG